MSVKFKRGFPRSRNAAIIANDEATTYGSDGTPLFPAVQLGAHASLTLTLTLTITMTMAAKRRE